MDSIYVAEENIPSESNSLAQANLDKAIIPFLRQHCREYNLQNFPKTSENIIYQYALQLDVWDSTMYFNMEKIGWRETINRLKACGFTKIAAVDGRTYKVLASTSMQDFPHVDEMNELGQSWYRKRSFCFFGKRFSFHDFDDNETACSWWIGNIMYSCFIACKFVNYFNLYLLVFAPYENIRDEDEDDDNNINVTSNTNSAPKHEILRIAKETLFDECGISNWWSVSSPRKRGSIISIKARPSIELDNEQLKEIQKDPEKEKEKEKEEGETENVSISHFIYDEAKTVAWIDDPVTLLIQFPQIIQKTAKLQLSQLEFNDTTLNDTISQIKTKIFSVNNKFHIGKQKLYFNQIDLTNRDQESLYQCCIENATGNHVFETGRLPKLTQKQRQREQQQQQEQQQKQQSQQPQTPLQENTNGENKHHDHHERLVIRLKLNPIVVTYSLADKDKLSLMELNRNGRDVNGKNNKFTISFADCESISSEYIEEMLNEKLKRLVKYKNIGHIPKAFIAPNELKKLNEIEPNAFGKVEINIEYSTNIVSIFAINTSLDSSVSNEMILYVPSSMSLNDAKTLIEEQTLALHYSELSFYYCKRSHVEIFIKDWPSTTALTDGQKIHFSTNIVTFCVDFSYFNDKWSRSNMQPQIQMVQKQKQKDNKNDHKDKLNEQWLKLCMVNPHLHSIKHRIGASIEYKTAVTNISNMNLDCNLPIELFINQSDNKQVLLTNHNMDLLKNGTINTIECRSAAMKLLIQLTPIPIAGEVKSQLSSSSSSSDMDKNSGNNKGNIKFDLFVSKRLYLNNLINIIHKDRKCSNRIPLIKQISSNITVHSNKGELIGTANIRSKSEECIYANLNSCGISDVNCAISLKYWNKINVECYHDEYTAGNKDCKILKLTVEPKTSFYSFVKYICDQFDEKEDDFISMEYNVKQIENNGKHKNEQQAQSKRVNYNANRTLFALFLDSLLKHNNDNNNNNNNSNKNSDDQLKSIILVAKFRKNFSLRIIHDIRQKEFKKMLKKHKLINNVIIWLSSKNCKFRNNDKIIDKLSKVTDTNTGIILTFKEERNCKNVVEMMIDYNIKLLSNFKKNIKTNTNTNEEKKNEEITQDNKNNKNNTNNKPVNKLELARFCLIVDFCGDTEKFIQSLNGNTSFASKFEKQVENGENKNGKEKMNVLIYCISKRQKGSCQVWTNKMNKAGIVYAKCVIQQKSVIQFVRNHCATIVK